MIEIKDKYINQLVKSILPTEVVNSDLVIAGGFATALYDFHLKSNYNKESLLFFIKKHLDSHFGKVFYGRGAEFIGNKYTDIDLWALENSSVSDYIKKLDGTYIETLRINDYHAQPASLFVGDAFKGLYLKRSSKYALTFNDKRYTEYQIIRRIYKDIEDIFACFDLNVCKSAWKDGILYVDESCAAAFQNRSLDFTADIGTGNLYEQLIRVSRLFKYYERYMFEPSKSVIEEILKIVNRVDFDKILKEEKEDWFKFPATLVTSSPYESNSESFRAIPRGILSRLGLIFEFANFERYMVGYLVGINDFSLQERMKKYLDSAPKTPGDINE